MWGINKLRELWRDANPSLKCSSSKTRKCLLWISKDSAEQCLQRFEGHSGAERKEIPPLYFLTLSWADHRHGYHLMPGNHHLSSGPLRPPPCWSPWLFSFSIGLQSILHTASGMTFQNHHAGCALPPQNFPRPRLTKAQLLSTRRPLCLLCSLISHSFLRFSPTCCPLAYTYLMFPKTQPCEFP